MVLQILSDVPLVWGVLRVTTHCRSKTAKSRIFCPHVCGLSQFENLIRLKKSYSVSPALWKIIQRLVPKDPVGKLTNHLCFLQLTSRLPSLCRSREKWSKDWYPKEGTIRSPPDRVFGSVFRSSVNRVFGYESLDHFSRDLHRLSTGSIDLCSRHSKPALLRQRPHSFSFNFSCDLHWLTRGNRKDLFTSFTFTWLLGLV